MKPPELVWWRSHVGNRVYRYRLYVDGAETPFFIVKSETAAHRYVSDCPYSVHGSGLAKKGIGAGTFGYHERLKEAKAKGEQLYQRWLAGEFLPAVSAH